MLFPILSFWILLYTNWFPDIEKKLRCSRKIIYFFLLSMVGSEFISPIGLGEFFSIHIGFLLILVTCILFFIQINENQRLPILSVLVSSSTIAFSFHEIYHFHMDWSLSSFRWFLVILFVLGALIAFRDLIGQVVYLWGGYLVTHCMIVFAHQEMLNPLQLGNQDFMDFCWLSMILLVGAHYGINPLLVRFWNSS